jgi:hypothetical protein
MKYLNPIMKEDDFVVSLSRKSISLSCYQCCNPISVPSEYNLHLLNLLKPSGNFTYEQV